MNAARLRTTVVLLVLLALASPSLSAQVAAIDTPCVMIHDLDFGTLAPGQPRTLSLRVCNEGGGVVTFDNPSGDAVVSWLLSTFTIPSGDLDRMHAARLAQGECISLSVTFSSSSVGTFRDTARFWASTRNCRDVSVWTARVTDPGPHITGYDWGRQWIVRGACSPPGNPRGTKNPAMEYLAQVFVYNTGDAPFIVESLELVGPDAAHFALGTAEAVRPGDRIRPITLPADTPRAYQQVNFRPGPEERAYSAELRLRTTDGKVVSSLLTGTGIESHVQSPGTVDLGSEPFVAGQARATAAVFSFEGTRRTTITGVEIRSSGGSPPPFRITNASGLIGVWERNSSLGVDIEYLPSAPGTHEAEIVLTGDFSPCDDSVATIVARSSTISARPIGTTFGEVLTCFDSSAQVWLENDGSDPIVVSGINVLYDGSAFGVQAPALPATLQPGERLPVDVSFFPQTEGVFTGWIEFLATSLDGTIAVTFNGQPLRADFTGAGRKVSGSAHISGDYAGYVGDTLQIEVVLDDDLRDARIDELDISLRFERRMLELLLSDPTAVNRMLDGTLLEGWTVSVLPGGIDPSDTEIALLSLTLSAPFGRYVSGTGALLRVPLHIHDDDTTSSELRVFVTPKSRLACAEVEASHGLARILPRPGADPGLVVTQVAPGRDIEVSFTNDIDRHVRIDLFNGLGEHVMTVLDGYLATKRHTLSFETDGLPVGQYYLRLIGGTREESAKVIIVP